MWKEEKEECEERCERKKIRLWKKKGRWIWKKKEEKCGRRKEEECRRRKEEECLGRCMSEIINIWPCLLSSPN